MHTASDQTELIACLDCDLLQRRATLERGQQARCASCNCLLYDLRRDSGQRTLALSLAGLLLFVLANTQAMITLRLEGREQTCTILSGAFELFDAQFFALGALVLLMIFVAPLFLNLGLIFVLLPLQLGLRLPGQRRVLHAIESLRPFAMLEVFLLGMLVAMVKLREWATLSVEPGFWALVALVVMSAAVYSCLDTRRLWARLEGRSIRQAGQPKKLRSVQRTWAFLIAAAILLVPANLYPVMTVEKLGRASTSTIVEGIRQLMDGDQHILALVVLVASLVVPAVKILGLAFLLISVQGRWDWRRRDRARLYRIIELIGRWSMLDIFVVAVLIALVKLDTLAAVTAEGGAVAFGAVVVLTMFASRSFDPGLIWAGARPSGWTNQERGG